MRIEGVTPHCSGFTAPELGLPLAGHCRRDHGETDGHKDQEAELHGRHRAKLNL
jgi:hypothetical protein